MVRAMQKSGEFRGCGAADAAKGIVPTAVEVFVANADLKHPGSQEDSGILIGPSDILTHITDKRSAAEMSKQIPTHICL